MKYFVLGVLLSLCMLAGCKETQSTQTNAVKYKKPHAPVDMVFTPSAKPQQGVSMEYELGFTPGVDADDLLVNVTADEGIELTGNEQPVHLGGVQSKQQYRLVVACRPMMQGVAYLNVAATLVTNGQRQSRSFSIPVKVGDGVVSNPLKASAVVSEDAAGERIISMPAQESRVPAK